MYVKREAQLTTHCTTNANIRHNLPILNFSHTPLFILLSLFQTDCYFFYDVLTRATWNV